MPTKADYLAALADAMDLRTKAEVRVTAALAELEAARTALNAADKAESTAKLNLETCLQKGGS